MENEKIFSLEGKNVAILGTGDIGAAIIKLLAGKKIGNVYAGDYSLESLEKLEEWFSGNAQGTFFSNGLNVIGPISREAWFEWVKNSGDRIDIFIYTAGVVGPTGVMTLPPQEEFEKIIKINFTSAVYFVNRFAEEIFRPQKFGRIVTIGSMAGYIPTLNAATYDASKAGLNAYMETFAKRMDVWRRKEGVDIKSNNFVFRMIATAMTNGMSEKDKEREFRRFRQDDFLTVADAARGVVHVLENDIHGAMFDGTAFDMRYALGEMRDFIPQHPLFSNSSAIKK